MESCIAGFSSPYFGTILRGPYLAEFLHITKCRVLGNAAAEGDARFVEYWERTVPWTFTKERLSYAERRRLRYELQDYMAHAIPFGSYNGRRILEIGSGSGIDSAEFGRNGAEPICVDFTTIGSTSTRDTLREAGLTAWDVIRGSAQALPFRDGAFDCVYSFGVLHHIPDLMRVLKGVARVLRAGGEFVCMMYNKDSLLYAYSILFLHRENGLTEEQVVSMYSERVEGCPYTKAFTRQELAELLSTEFKVTSVNAYFNAIDTRSQRKVKFHLPDDLHLGWHLVARVTKG